MAGRPKKRQAKRPAKRKPPEDSREVLRLRSEYLIILARARRRLPELDEDDLAKTCRVRLCVEVMARLEWVSGVTGNAVAEACGVHRDTVARDAAEAHRAITEAVATQDELRSMVIAGLQTVAKRTMAGKKPQLRTTVEALKALAGVAGIEAPKKHELGGEVFDFLRLALEGGQDEQQPDDGPADPGGAEALAGPDSVRP
jgi:hypothetical protein